MSLCVKMDFSLAVMAIVLSAVFSVMERKTAMMDLTKTHVVSEASCKVSIIFLLLIKKFKGVAHFQVY